MMRERTEKSKRFASGLCLFFGNKGRKKLRAACVSKWRPALSSAEDSGSADFDAERRTDKRGENGEVGFFTNGSRVWT